MISLFLVLVLTALALSAFDDASYAFARWRADRKLIRDWEETQDALRGECEDL